MRRVAFLGFIIGLGLSLSGCGTYTCKDQVSLGMTEQQALERVIGLKLIAEEATQKEYSCYLDLDCYSDSMFDTFEPYKLTFVDGILTRLEVDQIEKSRQEIQSTIHQHYDMRYRY